MAAPYPAVARPPPYFEKVWRNDKKVYFCSVIKK
jgi:hypothetical protein